MSIVKLTHSKSAGSTPPLSLKYDPHYPEQISLDARPLPLALGEREDVELHPYIDGSVIEVFVNNQVVYTKRF
jgi:hypothetical protein